MRQRAAGLIPTCPPHVNSTVNVQTVLLPAAAMISNHEYTKTVGSLPGYVVPAAMVSVIHGLLLPT